MMCPACRAIGQETDNFCHACGRALKPGLGFWHSHSGIVLLVLAVGPLALISVWTSRRISTALKAAYSVGIGLFSFYLFYSFWQVYRLVQEAMSLSFLAF